MRPCHLREPASQGTKRTRDGSLKLPGAAGEELAEAREAVAALQDQVAALGAELEAASARAKDLEQRLEVCALSLCLGKVAPG